MCSFYKRLIYSVFGSDPIQYPKREFLNDDDGDDKEKMKMKVIKVYMKYSFVLTISS